LVIDVVTLYSMIKSLLNIEFKCMLMFNIWPLLYNRNARARTCGHQIMQTQEPGDSTVENLS